jgi:hypothetical protein
VKLTINPETGNPKYVGRGRGGRRRRGGGRREDGGERREEGGRV